MASSSRPPIYTKTSDDGTTGSNRLPVRSPSIGMSSICWSLNPVFAGRV